MKKIETAKRRAAKYKKVFGSTEGQEVLADILHTSRFMQPCHTPQQEGMRQLGIAILKQVNGDMDQILKQLQQRELEEIDE